MAQSGGGTAWTLTADGGTTTIPHGGTTQLLTATNFGFAIPTTATIVGVQVSYGKGLTAVAGGVRDTVGYPALVGGGGANPGRSTLDVWTGDVPPLIYTYGGPTDTWNTATALTPAIVNASSFGVQIAARDQGAILSDPIQVTGIADRTPNARA